MNFLSEFNDAVKCEGFPCIFAPIAADQGELLFGIADVTHDFQPVVTLFDAAVQAISYDLRQTLVFWLTGLNSANVMEDRQAARQVLLTLLAADHEPWPQGEPIDPNHPNWNFWYKGIDFFVNFSTPHHLLRRSRNLGSTFTIVTQSRSTFDTLPAKTRHVIRNRISQYDKIPLSPALGFHGTSPELPQFFLGEDNDLSVATLLDVQDIRAILDCRRR